MLCVFFLLRPVYGMTRKATIEASEQYPLGNGSGYPCGMLMQRNSSRDAKNDYSHYYEEPDLEARPFQPTY